MGVLQRGLSISMKGSMLFCAGAVQTWLAHLLSQTSVGCPERVVRDESELNEREQLIWEKLMPSFLLHSSLPRTKDLRLGETQSSSYAVSVKVRSKHLSSAFKGNACVPSRPFSPLVFGQRQSGVF